MSLCSIITKAHTESAPLIAIVSINTVGEIGLSSTLVFTEFYSFVFQ